MVRTNALKAKFVENSMTQDDIAELIGISRTTLCNKVNNGTDFTLGELRKLKSILGLDASDVDSIFFADEVS